jgi:gluconate 2-dehydrogenase gamma chain
MSTRADDSGHTYVSRRDLLKLSLAATAVGIPLHVLGSAGSEGVPVGSADAGQSFETLTTAEGEALAAVVARLIPSDATGPGATEARAARYIDRALRGALAGLRQPYANGLAALDRYARSARGESFAKLSAADQDAVLMAVEAGTATGFTQPTASAFFAMVRAHTLQGTFGDPFYGGNADFVGWNLIGYPGLRLAVTPEDQRLGAKPTPARRSAYDHEMFVKAVVRNEGSHAAPARRSSRRTNHGD